MSKLWNAVKAAHRGNFVAPNACIMKEEKSEIICFHLKKLENKDQIKPQWKGA